MKRKDYRDIDREYRATYRLISRLWNTHTSGREIQGLFHDLDVARDNELRTLRGVKS